MNLKFDIQLTYLQKGFNSQKTSCSHSNLTTNTNQWLIKWGTEVETKNLEQTELE